MRQVGNCLNRSLKKAVSQFIDHNGKDNRNYIKEYLNLDVKEVVVPQSLIYSKPNERTKMYLIKGDVVTILEEKNKWIKIEYAGEELITGWIKKEDVE